MERKRRNGLQAGAVCLFCALLFALVLTGFLQPTGDAPAAAMGEDAVKHIFVHSLIENPEKAFASTKQQGYQDWFTTVLEFERALEELYKNQYILVDITTLCKKGEDGRVVKQTLALPKGKKPLVLSVDDVNYYDYMRRDGFPHKLVVKKDGFVTTLCKKQDGSFFENDRGDVVPIVDNFVKKHPDFSFGGAKGTLAVTGYEGVFGYRTTEGNHQASETSAAKEVALALKKTGWNVASHSYTHTQKFRNGSITMEEIHNELDKWESSIGKIVGETPVFVAPFGMHLMAGDKRLDAFLERGYYIYCTVDARMPSYYGKNYLVQGRFNLDGMNLVKYPTRVDAAFFPAKGIVDERRAVFGYQ